MGTPSTQPPQHPQGSAPAPHLRHKRRLFPRWRIFTWLILAFNVGMLIWVIAGANTGRSCGGLTGDALLNCQAGQVGTGIGVGLIIGLWAAGDVILGVLWLITRPHTRTCPACGDSVRRRLTRCSNCGFDFVQAATASQIGWTPR